MASVPEAGMHLAGKCALVYSILQNLCQHNGFVSAEYTSDQDCKQYLHLFATGMPL